MSITEALLLQSQGGVAAAALLPASRPRRGSRLRLRLRTRAQQTDLRQLVSVDDLRVARDDHSVNGRAPPGTTPTPEGARGGTGTAAQRLRAIAEAAADRADMHDIVGRQRDNWNHLLLHATNSLALTASLFSALAPAASPSPTTLAALRASAGVLLATAAVTMAAANRIQPSQLAEEQRNATRLWRQLERDVRAAALGNHGTATVTAQADDVLVDKAMDRVLALDAAYPLPLFPGMLDKFPATVEPTRWWPARRQPPPAQSSATKTINGAARRCATAGGNNGWTRELEDEMRGVVRVLRAKDEREYVCNAKLALRLNRVLAVAGPALAGTAALATAFIGSSSGEPASGAAVVCGALAAAANTVEHGWQLGMLFDMFRNVAGFHRKVQEDIEACLDEVDVERRENGEVFQTKVALLLGRSTADLRQFREMASPSFNDDDIKDFAGKLF